MFEQIILQRISFLQRILEILIIITFFLNIFDFLHLKNIDENTRYALTIFKRNLSVKKLDKIRKIHDGIFWDKNGFLEKKGEKILCMYFAKLYTRVLFMNTVYIYIDLDSEKPKMAYQVSPLDFVLLTLLILWGSLKFVTLFSIGEFDWELFRSSIFSFCQIGIPFFLFMLGIRILEIKKLFREVVNREGNLGSPGFGMVEN